MKFHGHDLDKLEERARDILDATLEEYGDDMDEYILSLVLALVKISEDEELDLICRWVDELRDIYGESE